MTSSFHRPLLLLLTLALLSAGCSLMVRPDPAGSEVLRQQAEDLVARRDFTAAAELLAQAINLQPDRGSLYLRRAELLERLDQPAAARRVYQQARSALAAETAETLEATWRLGLVNALRLEAPGKARSLLKRLPVDSPRHADLQGVLALQAGEPRKALEKFNLALAGNPENDIAAAILYHASLAYRQLQDESNTFGSLYHAVNRAGHLGLSGDIERLWNELNRE